MKNIAVVTGASRGIGRSISARLVNDGWRVFNVDRSPPTSPGEDTWIKADLSDSESLRYALEQVLRDGPVVGLVNNAAIGCSPGLLQTREEDFDISASINVRAPMQCAKMLVPGMREKGFGRIVNIASRTHLGKILRTAYAASKGALVSMTKVWR